MASGMYHHHREEALSAVSSGTLKVFAVSNAYTFDAAHTSINDVPAATRMHTSRALASVTFTNGELDAGDLTLTAASSASAIQALILWLEAGSSASSTLQVYLDLGGSPVTTNGGDIILQWAPSSPYIYKL